MDLPPDVMDFCRRAAAKFAARTKTSREDLQQEAMLAAWLALPRFEPDRGLHLTTFLGPRIHGAMLDYVRGYNEIVKVPRKAIERREQAEIRRTRSMDAMRDKARDSENELEDPPAPDADPSEDIERSDFWRDSSALYCLTREQRTIVRRHFRDDWTLKRIGEQLGVSESRISQMLSQALELLRGHSMFSDGPVGI